MSALLILDELSPDWVQRHGSRGVLAVRADLASAVEAAGFGPDEDGALTESALFGRRPLLELRTGAGTFVVRAFHHGGLARGLTGSRFRDPARPFRELLVSERLRAAEIRTPEVVAARARRAPGAGWHLALVTRHIAGASDLGHLLGAARRGEVARAALRRVLRGSGAFVRRLHELGCLHADLNPNNLLVTQSSLQSAEPELWIIDLDRSEIRNHVDAGQRRANLRRLYRHVARREARYGRCLNRADYARFLRGYEPMRRERKEHWRAVAAAHARWSAFHELGWMLESLGRKRDRRHEL